MKYNSTREKEIKEAMESGKYKIADLSIFKDFSKIKITENLLDHIKYTTELLEEYLNAVMELEDKNPGLKEYLTALKVGDIVDNQSLEKENSFMIGLYFHVNRDKAIDILMNYIKNDQTITPEKIYQIHDNLLYGTSSEGKTLIRNTNEKFVGRFENGQRIIDYFPIDYKDIEEATKNIAQLYNDRLNISDIDNVFLQPFLIHGLFGALQIFNDGNTRMGRLMQHTLIWQLINEKLNFDFNEPPIYATRSYYPYRSQYRNLISSLVTQNDDESWIKWFDFNLNRVEDQIYMNNENINEIKRRIR